MANELVRGMMALVTGEDLSQDATEVPFTPTGTISATTVQTAVAEAASEAVHLTGTETITGAKTFSIAPVAPGVTAPAATPVTIASPLGAAAADIAVKIGTSVASASVDGDARLVSVMRGLGGTEVEVASLRSGGRVNTAGGLRFEVAATPIFEFTAGLGLHPLINAYYAIFFSSANGGIGCTTAVKLKTEGVDGATAVAAQVDSVQGWADPAARLFSFRTAGVEKAAIAVGGIHPPKLAAAPAAPVEGQIYYDTTAHRLYCYDGTTWQGCW